MDHGLTLRAFREEDLGFLDRVCADPAALGEFEWFGFRDVRTWRRRWEKDGFIGPDSTALAVVSADGEVIGTASWKAVSRGGSPGACYEIGLALLPEHRGHGLGTAAQQLLVDHLFRFTTVHRLEAGTDADNVAEQKALERIGFTREGVLREVAFRDGSWRDTVIYALLRRDHPEADTTIADTAMAELRHQLAYKTTWYGSQLVLAHPFHPSSKMCSTCEWVKPSSRSISAGSRARRAAPPWSATAC